ncbi:MAG TPA: PaaI family thioesterase [Marmoricola sp.]|jgi:acyl-coenzyme A thioesterase PaaI-like protein|nr:PaaI family thioesterase [Marmoricola sp.]
MSRPPFEYPTVAMSEEEVEREREVYGGLAAAVRRLNETSLRSTVGEEGVREARELIERATARLGEQAIPGHFGVQLTTGGRVRGHGNAVVGLRNPIAVPLQITQDHDAGRATAEFELNALYEGPPGMVHGGVSALVLDQICGEAAAAGGHPGMTGTLSLRYRRPTPLGRCSAAGWLDSFDGVKATVKAELRRADGEVTVTAEGLFILPRWAREELAKARPPQYE